MDPVYSSCLHSPSVHMHSQLDSFTQTQEVCLTSGASTLSSNWRHCGEKETKEKRAKKTKKGERMYGESRLHKSFTSHA